MKKYYTLLLALTLFYVDVMAQDIENCYNSTRAEGIQLMQKKKYSEAIKFFTAAKDCFDKPANNDLQSKINECRRKIEEINKPVPPQDPPTPETGTDVNKPTDNKPDDAVYANTAYMEIVSISFGNTDKNDNVITKYGSTLFDNEMRYLTPKLQYNGLASESKTIELKTKIINPDGTLRRNTKTSPDGYTYSFNMTVYPGTNKTRTLLGWGNDEKSTYKAGIYQFELWYNEKKLYSTSFEIKSSDKLYEDKAYMDIVSVSFGNTDKNNNIITDYESTLFDSEMRYLTPKLQYNGLASISKTIEIKVKIINPNGSLNRSSENSPAGYTYSYKMTVYPGTNKNCILSGWGNNDKSTYEAGTYQFELWYNEKKLYSTTFEIKTNYLTVNNETSLLSSFEAKGGEKTYQVSSSAASWKTWGVPSWCSIKDETATSFKLKCYENTSTKPRKDYMKVQSGGKEVRIDISQTGKSRYSVWPGYYWNPYFGIRFAYTQRTFNVTGGNLDKPEKVTFFGEDGWMKGFQAGLFFDPSGLNPCGMFGLNIGLNLEMYFSTWKNAPHDYQYEYYDKYMDVNLYMPLDLTFHIPFGPESALCLYGGIGLDFNCYNELTISIDSYANPLTNQYGKDSFNRFNLSYEYGLNLKFRGIMFYATYQKGLSHHPIFSGYSTTMDKLSVGMSIVFGD